MALWREAVGLFGALLVFVFWGSNTRLPFVARYRTPGFAVGFLLWVLMAGPAGTEGSARPQWFTVIGASALTAAGIGRLLGLADLRRRQRADPAYAPDSAAERSASGKGLLRRYLRQGDVAALDRAVEELRSAAGGTVGDPRQAGHVLALIRGLRLRYERTRSLTDLDEAVTAGRRGVAAGLPGDRTRDGTRGGPERDGRRDGRRDRRRSLERGRLLSLLSGCLRLRYDHLGAVTDLDEAAELGGEAVLLIRDTSVHFPLCRAEFAAVLHSQYERTKEVPYLDRAVTQLRRALEAARRRGYERTVDLATFCYLLSRRGDSCGSTADLDAAVEAGRSALGQTAPGRGAFELCQNNLALALRTRWELRQRVEERTGGLQEGGGPHPYRLRAPTADLDEAIGLAHRAVGAVPADAPERAGYQLGLALALHCRYRYDRHQYAVDLDRALAALDEAARHPTADLPTRVKAGLARSDMAATAGQYAQAVRSFENVIGLLPQLAARELRRTDQEFRLGRWTGIAVAAAACALAAGEPEKAVTLLEQGRGVLLSRALDVRTDLTALRAEHPSLAARFEEVREALDGPAATSTGFGTGPSAATRGDEDRRRAARRELSERWDELLEEIRAQDGFAGFGGAPLPDLPTSGRTTPGHGDRGPVVFLNVSELRSDAIILEAGRIRTVPLDVRPDEATRQTRKLLDALHPDRILDPALQKPVHQVLAWLWDALVEPVVDCLDLRVPAPGEPLPRIWWVPTGPLALLPIHAAGHHGPGARTGARSLLDRAVPSYAPTLRALTAARARRKPAVPPRPLVVAMSRTPGAQPLRQAGAEAEAVRRLFPGSLVLADDGATRERLVEELPRHTWAHFACHAVTDQESPSRGRLLLHDHRLHPFTLADVSGLDLGRPELAYLSACGSAQTGLRHADEAIHLASSFQLAGFSHVIATLWPVFDRFALAFATDVYGQLAQDGGGMASATAVHRATLNARALYPNLPGLWASHVHVGP
ncbi:CHAT domain-containing protein [Streptomyces sp. NPDC006649]|uniref:CHAT domain-containing protein n=1 Tax=Streptomyces sp. NPDC006649 TaxID=3156896 RepID=UPI0033B71C4D